MGGELYGYPPEDDEHERNMEELQRELEELRRENDKNHEGSLLQRILRELLR